MWRGAEGHGGVRRGTEGHWWPLATTSKWVMIREFEVRGIFWGVIPILVE